MGAGAIFLPRRNLLFLFVMISFQHRACEDSSIEMGSRTPQGEAKIKQTRVILQASRFHSLSTGQKGVLPHGSEITIYTPLLSTNLIYFTKFTDSIRGFANAEARVSDRTGSRRRDLDGERLIYPFPPGRLDIFVSQRLTRQACSAGVSPARRFRRNYRVKQERA